MGWVGQSIFGWNSIMYNVSSFSLLIACYLVRLDKHFIGRCRKYFSGKDDSAPLEKMGRMPMVQNSRIVGLLYRYSLVLVILLCEAGAVLREARGGSCRQICYLFLPKISTNTIFITVILIYAYIHASSCPKICPPPEKRNVLIHCPTWNCGWLCAWKGAAPGEKVWPFVAPKRCDWWISA